MNNPTILETTRSMVNKICLVHQYELGRCIGYRTDSMDCYYHIRRRDGSEYYASAVGYCEPLDSIPGYAGLDSTFALNGCPPVPEFIISIATDEENAAMERSIDESNAKAFGMSYEEYVAENMRV